MRQLFTYGINRIIVRLAALFFVIGNLVCLIYLVEPEIITSLGIVFLIIFIVTYIIMGVILLFNILLHFKDIVEHTTVGILLFLNIPIAILWAYLLF